MLEGQRTAGAWERAAAHLARSLAFRLARVGLFFVSGLAVFAPFLASDRPFFLAGVHRGDFERERRALVPMTTAFAGLLASSAEAFHAARPAGAVQDLAAARASEAQASHVNLASLRRRLAPPARAALADFERALDAARALAEADRRAEATTAGTELLARARELATELEAERPRLVAERSFPLLEGLTPLEVGLAAAWLALATPFLRRRAGLLGALGLAAFGGLALGLAWNVALGGGRAFPTGLVKEQLTNGEIEAGSAWFPPVPYGFAEQHAEEGLRPPTWLAAAELDARGAYVRGPRAPRADPVTGFVPSTRAVEVRTGEPGLNSPWRHLLGTDTTGRDLLARVIHGARVSLAVGGLATLLLMLIGVTVGALAGTFGGVLDLALSRGIEVVLSFPLLFLVLVTVAFVGPSLAHVCLVLGCVGWTGVARLARTEFQRQRQLDHVAAARALGFSWARILLRHMLPNALGPLLVSATFSVAGAILIEAALSFLGYGVRVPVPSWGALGSESRDPAYWWLLVFPGFFLCVTVLSFQLAGDALREALDPRATTAHAPSPEMRASAAPAALPGGPA